MENPSGVQSPTNVPFFRPSIDEADIAEVADCLRSGWLTTGPKVKRFEEEMSKAVGALYAVALNSCTAALHLAVSALGLLCGQAVLVPTMTFAATAEVVLYLGALPLLVDCDPVTLNMDMEDAERKIKALRAGQTPLNRKSKVAGIMPVHVGGLMLDVDEVQAFARRHGLWIVEDAAHALPAAYRPSANALADGEEPCWRHCGNHTADVTCLSFYANKTITTGEGGMALCDDRQLADRMRQLSLHGLSYDAWKRYSDGVVWDYRIISPGYKYNFTDIAASIGIGQLRRAEAMRQEREAIARHYLREFQDLEQIELPPDPPDRIHAWHLFPIRLRLDRLAMDRNTFITKLRAEGVGTSVHWRPLHLHPYYEKTFGWTPEHLPAASAVWPRLISLPLFPGMREEERDHIVGVVRKLCADFGRSGNKNASVQEAAAI